LNTKQLMIGITLLSLALIFITSINPFLL
jgi:hypothetical protein